MRKQLAAFLMLSLIVTLLCACQFPFFREETEETDGDAWSSIDLSAIPPYDGKPYCEINGGEPYFTRADYTTESFEYYSELDSLGRCGMCWACIGRDLMPTEERGEIGQIRPSGWQTVRYEFIDKKFLYNRCHLIGYQLTAENDNPKNLITGTRYLNTEGMLPFENDVAYYIRRTGNHVLYRVVPVYRGKDLVATGVTIEAKSVEDGGLGIEFNVFCYNVQPGVEIDYATGRSREASGTKTKESPSYTYSEGAAETASPEPAAAAEEAG